MPDSGVVYQPTTIGYSYDTRGDGSGGNGINNSGGVRGGFLGLISRRKLTTQRWLEWVLLFIALAAFVSGLTTMLINIVSTENAQIHTSDEKGETESTTVGTVSTEVEKQDNSGARGSVAIGAVLILLGLLLGGCWVWLRFFRRGKSPRSGISGVSGQYGPVLTELPSQLKAKQGNAHDASAVPLSDQEEETRTLMQDTSTPVTASGGSAAANQIPG